MSNSKHINSECFFGSKYIRNNVEYRVVSSQVHSVFKMEQSKILSELVINKAQHRFSTTAKEIMLLKYNVWSDFLLDLEQFLITNWGSDTLPDDIKSMMDDRDKCYTTTIEDPHNGFDQEFVSIWEEVHGLLFHYLRNSIVHKYGSKARTFKIIADTISSIMAHTLYEVYEIDVLLYHTGTTTPSVLLHLDHLVTHIHESTGVNILLERYKTYSKTLDNPHVTLQVSIDKSTPLPLLTVYNELKSKCGNIEVAY